MQYGRVQINIYTTVQYNRLQYSTVQSIIWYNTQYSTRQYSTLQYNTDHSNTVQNSTVEYKTTQYSFNTINVKLETLNTALKKYCRPIWTYGSVRVEPAIPMCQASLLTTGLGRQSQQTNNNMLYL